jgi:hypothetical protein
MKRSRMKDLATNKAKVRMLIECMHKGGGAGLSSYWQALNVLAGGLLCELS